MDTLNTYIFGPASGGKAKQLVILLHGLGANGQDLIGLAPYFARALPDAVFVSPDAPYPCDMAPFGHQWFSLQEWTPESILRGVQQAAPILADYIAGQIKKYNVPASKVALVGFSQGTMMSLYAGPRYPETLAGVLGYSGALIEEPGTDMKKFNIMPIRLIHGMADMVVPVTAYYHAREVLERAGFPVSGNASTTLMHNIDEAGIESGSAFLKDILN